MEDGIARERRFMNDFWLFRKKFYEPQKENSYWMSLINEANELMKKYDNDDYLGGLVLTCIDDLEHRYARMEGRELICELPYDCQVTPYIKVKAPEGKIIDIYTDLYGMPVIEGVEPYDVPSPDPNHNRPIS